jgi:hypothetical protein
MLIGRFVSARIDVLHIQSVSGSTSTEPVSFLPSLHPITDLVAEASNLNQRTIDDPLLRLLDQQIQNVHSSLLVCKWPVTLMSCFFVTLLCWDMAGDRDGWFQALWVPIVGVGMVLAIWVWDRVLIAGALHGSWSQHVSSVISACFLCLNDHDPSDPSTHRPKNVQSFEFVRSSLHQSPVSAHEPSDVQSPQF